MITATFEEKLEQLVNLLPKHKNDDNAEYQIRFDWGSQEKLNEFMALSEAISKYPLIWLVEGKDTENQITEAITRNAKIIIATQSLGVSRNNREIYKAEYAGMLNPIKNNLITAFDKSGIVRYENILDVSRIQDYSWNNVNDENATGDVWMVIFLEAKITIDTKKCINNNIKF